MKTNLLYFIVCLIFVVSCQTQNIETADIASAGIKTIQQKLNSGEMTSEVLVNGYLNRINQFDKNGPNLNSIIELNPNVLTIAREFDKERKAGKTRGPLHGIPVLIKDNIDSGEKMMTTAGSLALKGHYAKNDAFLVKKLRDAGAIILGKTNLSEWANFRSNYSISGWSSRGGQTRNPYNSNFSPCGSSAGSAVAVAAGFCTVAIGTETNGSIVCPASANGIVGFKPTVGLISRDGIIPISKTQDTAGPLTNSVEDAALLMNFLTGFDSTDIASVHIQPTDFTHYLNEEYLRGKKIGVDKSAMRINEKMDTLFQRVICEIRKQGAEIIEIDLESKLMNAQMQEEKILQYEFKDGLNKYLADVKDIPCKSLKDIIQFNTTNASTVMPYFGQDVLISSEAKGSLNEKEYLDALSTLLDSRQIINSEIDLYHLDAICGPTLSPTCVIDSVNGDHFSWGYSTSAAIAGFPSINVPAGFIGGLPVGITFFGKAFSDDKLLGLAFSYEQNTHHRKAPELTK